MVDVRRAWSPKKGLKYLLEYLAKGPANTKNPWPVEAIIHFMEVLQDVRLIQVFGCLLGAAEREGEFVCPVCGECMWRVEDIATGMVIWSPLGHYQWLAGHQERGPP